MCFGGQAVDREPAAAAAELLGSFHGPLLKHLTSDAGQPQASDGTSQAAFGRMVGMQLTSSSIVQGGRKAEEQWSSAAEVKDCWV